MAGDPPGVPRQPGGVLLRSVRRHRKEEAGQWAGRPVHILLSQCNAHARTQTTRHARTHTLSHIVTQTCRLRPHIKTKTLITLGTVLKVIWITLSKLHTKSKGHHPRPVGESYEYKDAMKGKVWKTKDGGDGKGWFKRAP